jgi:hypothetical protein
MVKQHIEQKELNDSTNVVGFSILEDRSSV